MNKKAFTLIELLAVIVVLGILGAMAVGAYSNYVNKSKDKSFAMAEKTFITNVQGAYADCLNGSTNIFCDNHQSFGYQDEIVFLNELIETGYGEKIKNPYDTSAFCDEINSYVKVVGSGNSLNNLSANYEVCLICGDVKSTKCDDKIKPLDSNNNLSSLSVEGFKITPSFSSSVINYTLVNENDEIDIEASSITVNATAESSLATVTGTGTKTLMWGENKIDVIVTAENGNIKTYTITASRIQDNDATLKSLAVEGYSLTPTFSSDVINYNLVDENGGIQIETDSVIVTAEATSNLASITGTGTKMLMWGENKISVIVTAESGTIKTYVINIENKRPSPPVIIGGSEKWVTAPKTISIETEGTATSGVKEYEYYKSNSSTTPSDSVEVTGITSNEVIIDNEGKTYIWYRTVSNNGFRSDWSNSQLVDLRAVYVEDNLNGADPVLTSNLIPIKIASDGTVTKAATNNEWYNYANKEWANAVVLKDSSITYDDGATIPESNIESYFVWIPKYSYQLWDLGDYSALSSIEAKEQEIKIRFGLTNTSDSVTGECTTPGVAGESGNCEVGEYMTHPAFLAFDTTGFWVGKFEVGYDGATSKSGAQSNTTNVDKVIIKPNVYSWRNVKAGFAFQTSYEYLRNDESHLIKNTEWGAIAYLHHSLYGSQTSLRINNNKACITGYAAVEEPTKGYNAATSVAGNRIANTALGVDGTYAVNYLNSASVLASTTGNITGVYDMAGGAYDLTATYTTGATTVGGSSGITGIYSDFLTNPDWEKYYNKYSTTKQSNFNNRILGDATGEIGPFKSVTDPDSTARYRSSWYGDSAMFAYSSSPWMSRGGLYSFGIIGGAFGFYRVGGGASENVGYRIVLAPETMDETVDIKQILVNGNVADISKKEEYDYSIMVNNDITTATIQVETSNPDAKVVITDQDSNSALVEGNNYYTIKVTSANGLVTREYVLNVYRKYPRTTIVASSKFESGYSYSFSSSDYDYSPGGNIRCSYSASGTKISLYAASTDAGGNAAQYWLKLKYNIKGTSIIGMGQTVTVTTKCSTTISGAHTVNLYAGSKSLGTICKNRTGAATTYEYTMPNDGVAYTLGVFGYAHAVLPNDNTVNVTITGLYIE